MTKLPSIEDMDYASGYETAYGVSEDRLNALAQHQKNLHRFDVAPSFGRSLETDIAQLEKQRDALITNGYNVLTDTTSAAEAFRVEFAHTTTALEGNTLTLAETSMVLERDLSIPNKSMHDQLEVVDADAAYSFIRNEATKKSSLSNGLILSTHERIAAHLNVSKAGTYRTDQRYVSSSHIYPPPPTYIEPLINKLVDSAIAKPGLINATLFHLVFEDIHPFEDGNGRTGRALLNLQLLEAGYPPIAFKADRENARRYYDAIANFTEDIDKRDGTAMLKLVINLVAEELGKRATELE